jgi:transcriptional regulator with XRE-family HTH domain
MELGQRLKQARLDAGLSQRTLCGDDISRNMLSMIENGSARPSMDTLMCLASRLGKPVSYFLEEQAVSENQALLLRAKQLFREGNPRQALAALQQYRSPDAVFDDEKGLLTVKILMGLAQQALKESRRPYAKTLLLQAQEEQSVYVDSAVQRQLTVLLAQADASYASRLEVPEEELLLLAQGALEADDPKRASRLLDAVDARDGLWQLLRGQAAAACKEYAQAAVHLEKAQKAYPLEATRILELCFRELGDYKRAYECACRLRELE